MHSAAHCVCNAHNSPHTYPANEGIRRLNSPNAFRTTGNILIFFFFRFMFFIFWFLLKCHCGHGDGGRLWGLSNSVSERPLTVIIMLSFSTISNAHFVSNFDIISISMAFRCHRHCMFHTNWLIESQRSARMILLIIYSNLIEMTFRLMIIEWRSGQMRSGYLMAGGFEWAANRLGFVNPEAISDKAQLSVDHPQIHNSIPFPSFPRIIESQVAVHQQIVQNKQV